MEAYRKWVDKGAVAVQGWSNVDSEAALRYLAGDKIPYFSVSYAAHLTDPTGGGLADRSASPYVFPMGPSYSDGVRALISWALGRLAITYPRSSASVRPHGR